MNNSSEKFIVKRNKKTLGIVAMISLACAISMVIGFMRDFELLEFFPFDVVLIMFTSLSIYFIYKMISPPLLQINQEGVWTKETKLVPWSEIISFFTYEEIVDEFSGGYIMFYIGMKKVKVELDLPDKTYDQIREAINMYNTNLSLIDRGHREVNATKPSRL